MAHVFLEKLARESSVRSFREASVRTTDIRSTTSSGAKVFLQKLADRADQADRNDAMAQVSAKSLLQNSQPIQSAAAASAEDKASELLRLMQQNQAQENRLVNEYLTQGETLTGLGFGQTAQGRAAALPSPYEALMGKKAKRRAQDILQTAAAGSRAEYGKNLQRKAAVEWQMRDMEQKSRTQAEEAPERMTSQQIAAQRKEQENLQVSYTAAAEEVEDLQRRIDEYREQQRLAEELSKDPKAEYGKNLQRSDALAWEMRELEKKSEALALRAENAKTSQEIAAVRKEQDEVLAQWEALSRQKQAADMEITQYRRTGKVMDSYSQMMQEEDFRQYADQRDYGNPNYTNAIMSELHGEPMEYEDWLGMYLSLTPEQRTGGYAFSQDLSNHSELKKIFNTAKKQSWDQLTQEEIGVYYYLLGKQGKETAEKYLEDMTTELNRRETAQGLQEIDQASGWKKVGLNVASVPMNLVGGFTAFADDAIRTMQGKEINPYSSWHELQNYAQGIRSSTARDFDEATGNKEVFGITAGDVYQSFMSGVDTIAGGLALGPGAYGVIMGMGASSARAKELYEAGANKEQIAAGGLLAGVTEAVFEKVSIENLINMKDAAGIWMVVKNAMIQGGVEASEEASTEIANLITDAILLGDKSQWQSAVQRYLDEGLSQTEAQAMALQEMGQNVWKAGAGGFLSGLLTGGSTQAAGYAAKQGNRNGTASAKAEPGLSDVDRAFQMTFNQNKNASAGMAEANTMLTEDDLETYLTVGERQHVRDTKLSQLQGGDSPILTSIQAVRDFIKKSLDRKIQNTIKAYGRVGSQMVNDVLEKSAGAVNIGGYYLELDSNRLTHLSDHIEDDGDKRNIPLTEEQALSIPDYINNYDDILGVETKKDGGKRIVLGKRINGHAVVVVLASKGRSSIQPVTAWQNKTDHYIEKYKVGTRTTSQTASRQPTRGYKRVPMDTVSPPPRPVNPSIVDKSFQDTFNQAKEWQAHTEKQNI